MIDIIGDIHGYADKLEELLLKLGYSKRNGAYTHTERKVLFVGDYIDRGPKIRKTLQLVKAMVDNNNAIALMGNHEYNALCFHIHHPNGGHLRPHLIKNINQHYKTLNAFHRKQHELDDYLEWFRSLPLFYENEHFRAVHAYWNPKNIGYLKSISQAPLTDKHLLESSIKGSEMYKAFDETLKGIEIKMPEGMQWEDHEKNVREEIRTRWWENPAKMTYRNISVEPIEQLPDLALDAKTLSTLDHYADNKPVFFGHYWLKGTPKLLKQNICCVDFSIAKKGKLVAYRFCGEARLNDKNLVSV
jgi:hypothetical protein